MFLIENIFFPLLSRNKIDVQPGQNVLKVIQDCFESKLLFGFLLNLLIKNVFSSLCYI